MADKINLNTARSETLANLPGIGPGLAERIVDYRNKVGRFRTVAELAAVAGITEQMIARFRDRVTIDDTADETEEELPPTNVKVVLAGGSDENFTGHRLTANFTRREWLEGAEGVRTSVWVPAATSVDLPASGDVTLSFPNRADMQGDVTFQVFAPDGEVLLKESQLAEKLPERLQFSVKSKDFATIEPNDDPNFGKPTRLKGRVIDESGRRQVSDTLVILWGAQETEPTEADFRPLLAVQTDKSGYFSGPYPLGAFTSVFGAVALGGDEPIKIPVHLEDDQSIPESIILVVDFSDVGVPDEKKDCECEERPDAPRDPDRAELTRADGTFSSDPGAGKCVDFTKPDRTLEEFRYSYVVRTTEPGIKGLTLDEPSKIDITKIVGLLSKGALLSTDRTDDRDDVPRMAQQTLATDKIDASVLHTLARDPDGFSLTKLATAANLTVHSDILRIVAQHIGREPGRGFLTCGNPVDWDDEPTIYQACTIAHGHILHFKQEWVADGYSMGNLLYSLPLAPGQKKLIAIVDWERRESAARTEALEEREELDAFISRDRDINEIVSATVSESVRGGSKSSSGGFAGGLGIGAILGPVGGVLGIGGGMSSADSSAWQRSSRATAASALNQLRDRTIQSASAVRSQRSSVVQTVRQGERVVATTETVANYNHCHAITIEYFEVLRHMLVRQRLTDVQECLFVPLLMSRFTSDKTLRWRNTLRTTVANRRLRAGFDALERIKNNYVGSDFPVGTYADQLLEDAEGDIYLRFQLARPKDKDDDFDANAWVFIGNLLPFISASDFYKQYLKDQALKDRIFIEQMAPQIAERFVQHLQFFAVDQGNVRTKIPVDTTLVTHFANDRPLYVSLRLAGALPPIARKDIKYIEISDISGIIFNLPIFQLLPAGSKVIVESGNMRYRTKYSSDYLFRDSRIMNDLTGGDSVRIFTPLNQQEMRNPREEDKELARQLLDHLNEHIEHYHHAIWWRMSPDRRYMLLDGFQAPNSGGRSVASVVENDLIGIVGNCLVMPVARGFHLDPTFKQDEREPIDLIEHYQPNTPIEPSRIAVPTRGVYAEAVMGACNSCEMKEEQRFWRWEESPIPDSPPAIQPVSTESRRAEPPDLTAKDFPTPIINLQNAPAAPDPTGLAAAMQLLGTPNLFKDITGLEGTQRNAAAALQSAFDTAKFFGGKAADLALQAKMAKDVDKSMRTIQSAKQAGLITDQQAQELASNAIRGMIGGGTQAPAQPMTTQDVQNLTKTAGENTAAVDVNRPSGERVSVDARTASLKEPIQTLCGFFGFNGGQLTEADLRDAIRIAVEDEHRNWFNATGNALKESDDSQFGRLVFYWLGSFSAIHPTTLTHMQTKAISGTINFGHLLDPATASNSTINTEVARVRGELLAGAPDASAPATLASLVDQALRGARFSRLDDPSNGPWSAVFVVSKVRQVAIQQTLEAMTSSGTHGGRDELLLGGSAHRFYVREAHSRRFGPNRKDETYHAFRISERTPQVGDIIVQDRQTNNINGVLEFDRIPTALASGFALHGDIVVQVEAGSVITIGGNLSPQIPPPPASQAVLRRRYPLDATGHLVVAREQLFTQENDTGVLDPVPPVDASAGLNDHSTGRIFAILSLVPQCGVAIPGQKVDGGVLT